MVASISASALARSSPWRSSGSIAAASSWNRSTLSRFTAMPWTNPAACMAASASSTVPL
jgi:hypothetical protein